jgi:hypothetical protein
LNNYSISINCIIIIDKKKNSIYTIKKIFTPLIHLNVFFIKQCTLNPTNILIIFKINICYSVNRLFNFTTPNMDVYHVHNTHCTFLWYICPKDVIHF